MQLFRNNTLHNSAKRGVKWNFISQGGQQITQILTAAILARLLSPNDFGLLSMATIIIGFLNVFKDLGTASAVIRSRETSDQLLSTVFWINVLFGCLAAALLFLSTPLIALFFHQPRLAPVLHLLSLGFVISGLSNLHKALLEKKLAFHSLAKIELLSVLAGAIVGVSAALYGLGVWALVAQSMVSSCLLTLLLWCVAGYRPRLIFSRSEFRAVSSFSLNLTGFNSLNYLVRNADNMIIGRVLGAVPLGIYALAYRIMLYPQISITAVITRVMYPVYSRIQEDNLLLRQAYARTVGMIALVTFPLMAGLAVLARPFVLVTFGQKWAGLIVLLQLFGPLSMFQSIAATTGSVFQAKGRSDILFRWGIFSSIITIASFLVGIRWGIFGVAACYTAVGILIVLPCMMLAIRLIDMKLRDLFPVLLPPSLGSLVMALFLFLYQSLLGNCYTVFNLVFMILAGAFIYTLYIWFTDRQTLRSFLDAIGNRAAA